jgi:hypothetical protein
MSSLILPGFLSLPLELSFFHLNQAAITSESTGRRRLVPGEDIDIASVVKVTTVL